MQLQLAVQVELLVEFLMLRMQILLIAYKEVHAFIVLAKLQNVASMYDFIS